MKFETISASKIEECIANKDMIIIDVRNPNEYHKGHIPTSINIPYNKFDKLKKACLRKRH